jgi:flagellar motor switch protein FliG
MSYRSEQRMRKAAILVTSLDRQSARQIRQGLSPADTTSLERAIAGLGPIDPEEKNDVLHEFRLSTASAKHDSSGVEVEWSTSGPTQPSRPHQHALPIGENDSAAATESGQSNWQSTSEQNDSFKFLHEVKPAIVAELLAGEHAQTSAAVLAQLPAPLVAQLLSSMPATCQVDILERLAAPHPADPQAMRIIQNHLADWLEAHRQQTARLSQGSEMVRQILSHASAKHRRKLISQLDKQGSRLADLTTPLPTDQACPEDQAGTQSTRNDPPVSARSRQAGQARDLELAIAQTSQKATTDDRGVAVDYDRVTANPPPDRLNGSQTLPIPEDQPQPRTETSSNTPYADMANLEAIDPRSLLKALEQIDPQVAQLALVGAPKWLLDQIAAQLPRRQARRLKQSLRTIEPTRLSDMLAAQQEFTKRVLQHATQAQALSGTYQ